MIPRQSQPERLEAEKEVRERGLQLLAKARRDADPRYVQDVVGFLWGNLLERKLRNPELLAEAERRRLRTLVSLSKAA